MPPKTARGAGHGSVASRAVAVAAAIVLAFAIVAGQLVRLAMRGQNGLSSNISSPIAESFARPDIVDRNGRILATDVEAPSLFADPSLVVDRDVLVEKLATILPDLDAEAVRASLADHSKRFVWVRRGLSPRTAQRIHDLGLPGLSFKSELKRAYPAAALAGHVLGAVNVDNKGLAGIERFIDESVGVEAVQGATLSDRAPVRLSLDMGVQHSVEDELARAIRRYGAEGAAGLVMDVATGEVVAAVSLPGVDPARPAQAIDAAHIDRLADGTYELGSIFKTLTIAMALEAGQVGLDTKLDVTRPIVEGRFTFQDGHAAGRPLTVAEVFTHSSNVGAGLLALAAGPDRQKQFLRQLGLLDGMRTEAGPTAPPQVPRRWGRVEQITVSYGHGLAVAPLQLAAAAAALVNGGGLVAPTFLKRRPGEEIGRFRVVSAATSARIRQLMRLNVTDPAGTGGEADVPGYRVGGKTGTAEMAGRGGYREKQVIASFLAAFPMDQPRFLTLVMLFEPLAGGSGANRITAATNAAPTTARIIARIAPQLGILPDNRLAAAD